MTWEADCRVLGENEGKKALSKGERGNSKFAVSANETSLQVGVTRVVAAESFTDPVA